MNLKYSSILIFFICSFYCAGQNKEGLLKAIKEYRELTNDSDLSDSLRLEYGKKAVELSRITKSDTTLLKSSKSLSYTYLMTGKYDDFSEINHFNLGLAEKVKDTMAIAVANFNIGWYEYQVKDNTTESYKYYLKALKFFSKINDLKHQALSLTVIATIQDDEKNYLQSEQNAIQALRILNGLDDDGILSTKYNLLNLLGLTAYKLKEFDKSIEYHNEAFEITKKMEDGYFTGLESRNNLALPYREKGDFKRALSIYKDLVSNEELKAYDISFYALIIDNYAFTKFLSGNYDYKDLEKEFKKSLRISDSIDDQYTKLAASIDIAKLYKANDKTDSSLFYAKQSYNISKDIGINDLLLESMLLLSDLKTGKESIKYLREHIKLSDSLLKAERSVRNKSARIEFEADQLEAENEQITKERLYLLFISIGLLFTAILIYVVISQRAKNKELRLIQAQQKANEDIYNLMLGQQDKIDEARAKEKIRVSKELHDGVLGRLFGTRLSLDSINFKEGKEAMMTRANYIGQLKTIEEDIRKISHELNTDFVSGSGFMDIVSELIKNQSLAYGLTADFEFTDDINWDTVPNKTKINIYRIIQESMQNIYKHANAKHIKIDILLNKNVILLEIADDGDGFDTSKSKKGIGLKNMASRVEEIKGKITFKSEPGKGTKVNVKIPYRTKPT